VTICKTVCPVLLDHCLSVCPVCPYVTLVYCVQTVGWIKVKLGIQVGLGPGHIVLDGDTAPPKKGTHPRFWLMFIAVKQLDGSRCQALAQATLCCMGTQLPPKRGTAPKFQPMSIVAKWSPISATAELLFYNCVLSHTVGWVLGRPSGLQNDEVLTWLSVWSEMQTICIWSS